MQTIVSGTSASISAINRITGVIDEISGIQSSIASAVEQQAGAMRGIAGSSAETAERGRQIASSVALVIVMPDESASLSELDLIAKK